MAITCYFDCDASVATQPLTFGAGVVTVTGNVTTPPGVFGNALRADAASTHFTFPVNGNINLAVGTIGFYFNIASVVNDSVIWQADLGNVGLSIRGIDNTTLRYRFRGNYLDVPFTLNTTHFIELAWTTASSGLMSWRMDGGSWTQGSASGGEPVSSNVAFLNHLSLVNDIWVDQVIVGNTYQENIYAVRNNAWHTQINAMPDSSSFGGRSAWDTGCWYGEFAYMYSLGIMEMSLSKTGFRGAIKAEPDKFGMPIVAAAGAASEDIATTGTAESSLTALQTFVDAVLSTAVAVSGVTDAQNYIDSVLSTGAGVSTISDAIVFVESAASVAVSQSTITDQQEYLESVLSSASAQSSVAEVQEFFESAATVAASISSIADVQAFSESVQSVAAAASSISDIQGFLDSYNSTILSLSSVDDRRLMVDNINIMAQSSVAISEIMQYLDQLQSVAVSGGSVIDMLQAAFTGLVYTIGIAAYRFVEIDTEFFDSLTVSVNSTRLLSATITDTRG